MRKHTDEFNKKYFDKVVTLINNDDFDNITHIVNLIKKYSTINDFLIGINGDELMMQKFITKCNIDYNLFKTTKDKIIKKCTGNYKIKYCLEYKLILIFHMLNDFTNWKALTKSIFYEPALDVKYHYKNIRRQYEYWCSKGIFKDVFYDVVPIDNNVIPNSTCNNNNNFYNVDVKTDLFIDSTHISNKNGFEDVVINPELKKKNITKISTLSDVDGFIYSVSLFKSKTKKIMYNKKQKEIKTANHDTELVQDLLDECNPNIKIYKTENEYTLIGDKGYKTQQKFLIQKEKITTLTPNKKNQKKNLINRHQTN